MNRPNIVFVMPDQLRYDFLSCYPSPRTHVPLCPPRFSISRNLEITIPRSTPLHMS